jgi:HD superfamily phosphohydrolase
MGFSELELKVIESSAFRRLRRVKQLGMAALVYPTADYSRFSHSLGVCHLAGRFMSQLEKSGDVTPNEIKLTRLAALTHDLGHYPFSHAFEEALKKYRSKSVVQKDEADFSRQPFKALGHEEVSERVLEHDPELKSILGSLDFREISRRFRHELPAMIGTNVVSSDLDVDRTDFLLRTARFAGLPYGSVDLDYIVSNLSLTDFEGRKQICLPIKTLRAAEHFLLGRFFDYQTVAYHKTVCAFESALEEAIMRLLEAGKICCAEDDVNQKIKKGTWASFDDEALTLLMTDHRSSCGAKDEDKARFSALVGSLFDRTAPKLIGEVEFIAQEDSTETDGFEAKILKVENTLLGMPDLAPHLLTWKNPGMKLTKLGTARSIEKDAQDADQLVHIKMANGDLVPMVQMPRSLMNVLSNYRWYCARFYSLDRSDKCNGWRVAATRLLTAEFGDERVTSLKAC